MFLLVETMLPSYMYMYMCAIGCTACDVTTWEGHVMVGI